ncbi:MAG TPA: cold shock domain-containing protein [Allocoleopsis sp.]
MNRGQLVTWKDEKGFGFIKPDDDSKEIFLHISALPRASRRPRVGDTILYEQVVQADGKVRAANASIEGVALRSPSVKRKLKQPTPLDPIMRIVVGIGGIAAIALFTMQFSPSRSPSVITAITETTAITNPGCVIKGNISVTTGDRIYHLPGMEDYASTVIDLIEGERWFCTESEAIENGWRKAPR